jgi:hypothetical protein
VILLERRRRRERSDWPRSTQQGREDFGGIELTLLNGAEDAGQYLLRLRALGGSVPATDFARNDGGTQGLFGTPVGRIDRGVEQKGEDRRVFDREVRGKALRDTPAARPIDEGIEPVLEMATRDSDTARRDRALVPAIAHPQRLLEDTADAGREGPLLMIADEGAAGRQGAVLHFRRFQTDVGGRRDRLGDLPGQYSQSALRSAYLGRRGHQQHYPLRRDRRPEVPDQRSPNGNDVGTVVAHHGGAELAGWCEEISWTATAADVGTRSDEGDDAPARALRRFWIRSITPEPRRAVLISVRNDVSPDGQRFLMIKDTPSGDQKSAAPPASMVVVLNWLGVRPSNRRDNHIPSCCASTTSVAALGDGRLGVSRAIEPEERPELGFMCTGDTA